ncbi:carboxyl-terminal protease [Robertkochia marina]|uniref:Carboxyl-terminal protease n=1 Tax=Robertkochia marina TaxID=1227945 RepID=A0A4S3M1P0_9FLAO|nr:S41 family peptidase [Robertkochia marina]THD67469.1 carboxyl-terminal protease [Robertkochia marina]TRZ44662.1 carboxyl-terminal protease [Robertkochia marina]
MKKALPFYLILLLVFISACTDQDDNIFVPDAETEIQDFIWKGLNTYYFWQADVADLRDDRFGSQEDYQTFLSQYSDPSDLFDALLSPEDRFSYITDDYVELQNARAGNFDSNGMEFGLIGYTDSDRVDGYVRYVYEGSDADLKGIKRGDLFTGVNGQRLNRANYFELLFGESSGQYTLDMAAFDTQDMIVPNGQSVDLAKSPATLNPVFLVKTFDLSNGVKAGYLMYNRFTATFDQKLNQAFGELKAAGIDELVLDMRYNPGGSVNSSVNLASMITGQFNNDLFVSLKYNQKQQRFNTDYKFRSTLSGEGINSLELTRVYVITTARTASASELIINGLDPYIDVIQVGDVTTGKNEASVTLYDSPSFRFDDEALNPNHTWAMQPIIARNENSIGFSDYIDGFVPEVPLREDLRNLGVLGEVSEPLLARALSQIDPSLAPKFLPLPTLAGKELLGSDWHELLKNDMYLEDPL